MTTSGVEMECSGLEALGKWAVIDIETTGINPATDSIIDVGFLQFEGGTLVRTYSSLVHFSGELSRFIQKLTGITPSQLTHAPAWEKVLPHIEDLKGHTLIAHNSDFEEGFLGHLFAGASTPFADSLPLLGLFFPQRSHLNLESFICDFGLAEKEAHRGYQDSLDLLKVLLLSFHSLYQQKGKKLHLETVLSRYHLQQNFFAKLFSLGPKAFKYLADQVELDLEKNLSLLGSKKAQSLDAALPAETPQYQKSFAMEFSGENIQSILQDTDKVTQKIPHYTYRQSQEALSLKTGQCFKNEVHAFIQAPTGTGKTLGYLLPAALFSMTEGKQVLVATGTKTLQNQALTKDIPQLRNLLGLPPHEFKVSRLIGSNNHLCELQFRKMTEEVDLFMGNQGESERFAMAYLDMVFRFNGDATQDLNFLTREDLSYVLKKKNKHLAQLEKEVAVNFRVCIGNKCPFSGGCGYIQGLRQAKEADLIIGNHALMFSWPSGFARPSYVIVDEAHRIEGEATSIFTLTLSQTDLEALLKGLENLQGLGALFYLLSLEEREETGEIINRLREMAKMSADILKDQIQDLPMLIETHFKKTSRYTALYWNELPMIRKNSLNDPLAASIFHRFDSVFHIIKNLEETLVPYLGMWQPKELDQENKIISYARFEAFVSQISDLEKVLSQVLQAIPDYTHSLKYHEEQGYSLESAPINIGLKVHDNLLSPSSSVVFTSATLGNMAGDQGMGGIEWPLGYNYLPQGKRFKKGFFLPPVFDYKNKSKVYLCDDTLEIHDRQFVPKTLKTLIPLIEKLGGRSLLLYSSKVRFEEAREILLDHFEGKISLFIQGMGSRVVEDFKNSENGILLGMEAFGEGIDIPGQSLQFIYIDKIPDLRMDLIIGERRKFFEKTFGNEFQDYFLAQRARGLQQKLGRLLRTERDFGGIIISDSRVAQWKPSTREYFQKLLGPYDVQRATLSEACRQVENFLHG